MIRYKGKEYATSMEAAQATGTPYSYVKEHLDDDDVFEKAVKKVKKNK